MNEHEDEETHFVVRPLGSRVSVLEFRQDTTDTKLDSISQKLDDLLELKHKGMGAVRLVVILAAAASGTAGFIAFLMSMFSGR